MINYPKAYITLVSMQISSCYTQCHCSYHWISGCGYGRQVYRAGPTHWTCVHGESPSLLRDDDCRVKITTATFYRAQCIIICCHAVFWFIPPTVRGLQINLLQFVAIYQGMWIRPATPPDRGTIVTQQTRPVAVFYKLNTII